MKTFLPGLGLFAVLAVSFLAVPSLAEAQVVVVGSTIQEREMSAGGQYTGTIRLRNTAHEPTEVRVYQADYSFGAAGDNQFPEPGTQPRSNADWISFTPSQVTLGPREEGAVTYTVTVPETDVGSESGSELRGTYWSVLMVEGVPVTPTDTDLASGEFGIRPRVRFAVQLASHVDGPGSDDLELGELRVTTGEEERILSIDVVNAGERAYRPEITLHLYSEDGDSVGVFGDRRGLLYPGTGLRQRFDISEVPAGSYEALITVDTGGPELFGAQVQVTF